MARRDVDVVIGARTDRSAFAKTEQETKGFLSRLRGASGPGGTTNALERTAKAQEMFSKVVAAAAVLKEGVAALNASLEIGRGLMQGMAGDAEAFNKSIVAAKDAMSGSMVGAAGLTIGEAIFGDQRDAAKIMESLNRDKANFDAANARAVRRTIELERARAELSKISAEQFRRHEEEGLNAMELQTLQLKRQYAEREKSLYLLQKELRALEKYMDVSQELTSLEAIRNELFNERARALGRLREEQAIESRKIVREQMDKFLGYFRGGRQPEPEAPAEIPFGASLPSLLTGNLLTGAAAQSEQGASLANRQVKAAEETNVKLDRQTSILSQILQATRGQTLAPVLQNF